MERQQFRLPTVDLNETADWVKARRAELEDFGDDVGAALDRGLQIGLAAGKDYRALQSPGTLNRKRPVLGTAPAPPGNQGGESRRAPDPRLGAPIKTVADLRSQQALFRREVDRVARGTRWMAAPALAPAVVVAGLGALEAAAGRALAQQAARQPLKFLEREPIKRGGDTYYTRIGKNAHRAFREKVRAKEGWDAELETIESDGRVYRPDASAPARDPLNPTSRFRLELKPNTPSGRKAAAKAVSKYTDQLGDKTRAVFCDPKAFR